ncbi:MAG: trifunctional dihydropteroate synthetase [Cirrosporium novae-zelandiae]|nr:MAG: trifunctional dihydropteroate synthetase [Cirrosporium novae-zelandiae]
MGLHSPSVSSSASINHAIRTVRHTSSSTIGGSSSVLGQNHRAFVAFGSNMGNCLETIEKACHLLDRRGIKVTRTSSLWQTAPMYYENQDPFLNGVCEVETSLDPIGLLDQLQDIENELGRVRKISKGPRTIDLDILLYDSQVMNTPRLTIPHPLMLEREFVLRPLCELIPDEPLPGMDQQTAFSTYLQELNTPPDAVLQAPTSHRLPFLKPLTPSRATEIMAVLNLTPDSFSDGGLRSPSDMSALDQTVRSFIESGTTIIDIGGQSTRPGAPVVGEQEELRRILPAIKHVRSMPEANNIAISVDTYYASVAKASLEAGADIINDVSAGLLDPSMLPTTASLGATIILMHMRGTPETMSKLTHYPNGIIEGVAQELLARVREAQAAGIRRWRIILDPGIGFAKTQDQNLALLRNMDKLRGYPGLAGFPWLVGTSRKGFIGKITGVMKPAKRGWGTAAAVTAAIKGGADIVRVHDVSEMAAVAKMADALFRAQE